MKEVNKGILDNDTVISTENIQKMGEVIALTCIKTVIVRSGKDLHYLYKGLLRDINRSKDDYSPFSNAYDIAQEAMLFLCQHIGEKLGDDYTTKYGKVVTIFRPYFSRYTLSTSNFFGEKISISLLLPALSNPPFVSIIHVSPLTDTI